MPFAAIMLVRREIVAFTGRGLSLVMMPDWPAESSSVVVISYLPSWPNLATTNPSPAKASEVRSQTSSLRLLASSPHSRAVACVQQLLRSAMRPRRHR
jgi:hypothetical protein